MADENNNGILDDEEVAAYKAHAASGKFKQQLAYGVGAAMVFGLVGAIAQGLLKGIVWNGVASLTSASFILPVLGLVALGAAGVGLLYISAKFLSENTLADQELQARQIQAAQGKAPSVTPEVTAPQPNFPSALPASLDAAADTQADAAPEKKWTDKFAPSASPAAILSNANDNEKSWGDKVTSAKAAAQDPAAVQSLAAL